MKQTNLERFDAWMRETVQSIYYSDNQQMSNAYERID